MTCLKHPNGCGPYPFGLSWAENHVDESLRMNSEAVMFAASGFDEGRASMLAELNAHPALAVAKFHRVFNAVGAANKLMAEVGQIVDDMANAIPDDSKLLKPKPDEGLYYIEQTDHRGDCSIWWRPDGKGYTRVLDEAWKVDEAKATAICKSRPGQDVMRKVVDVEALAVRHVPR